MTIAEKLITIADNTPAVAEAVNAAKATVTGTTIRVDDVLTAEHPLKVQLKSKNLFNITDRVVRDFGALANTTQRTFTENSVYLNLALNNYCNAGHKMVYEKISDSSFTVLTPSNSAGGWEGYGAAFNFRVTPNTAYSISASYDNTKGVLIGCNFYDENGNYISYAQKTENITTPSNCAWMNVVFRVLLRDEAVLFENVQLEQNATVTEYMPYNVNLEDTEVTCYGKNLFNKLKYANGSMYTKYIVDGDYITSVTSTEFEYVYVNIADIWHVLKKASGKKATFSFDLRADVPGVVTFYTLGQYLINFAYASVRGKFDVTTEWQHVTTTVPIHNKSFTIDANRTGGDCALSWYGTYDTGVKPYVRNLQIEISDVETEYEAYKEPQTAIADASGKVKGLLPVVPSMTLVSDAWIECTYFPTSAEPVYEKYQQLKADQIALAESIKEG